MTVKQEPYAKIDNIWKTIYQCPFIEECQKPIDQDFASEDPLYEICKAKCKGSLLYDKNGTDICMIKAFPGLYNPKDLKVYTAPELGIFGKIKRFLIGK